MIPKKIYYCWFGKKQLPSLAKKCIKSWKKYLPDYEIIELNESNFDVNIIPYTQEAYKAKRYAFVSDYARYYILNQNGGVYFDTDVEIIRPLNDILERGAYMGCETLTTDNSELYVAAGLGMACEKDNALLKRMIEIYSDLHFVNENGTHNLKTIVQYTTEILVKDGLKKVNQVQNIDGFWIYPKDYFNPLDYDSGKLIITNNTRSIHHFAASWLTPKEKMMRYIEKKYGQIITNLVHRLYHIFK